MLNETTTNSFSKWGSINHLLLPFLLMISPWLIYGYDFPVTLVRELDHCPQLGCDFTRHYLTQAQYLVDGAGKMDGGWFYPPLLAIALVPFTTFDDPTAIWTLINIAAIGGVVFWMVRLSGKRSLMWSIALCSTSLPILHSIKWGQVSLLLTVGLLYFLFGKSERFRSIVLGLIAAIKVYPILFVLKPLLNKRVSAVMVSFLTAIFFGVVVPYLILGEQAEQYFYSLQRGQQLVQEMANTSGGQSLNSVLHRWFISGAHIGGDWSSEPILLSIPQAKWLGLMLALVFAGVSVYKSRVKQSENWMILQLLLVVHLFIQPGWVHYFCFIPVAQIFYWRQTNRLGRSFVLGAVLLERVPIWWLDNEVYFTFVRSGGLTMVLLFLWVASLCPKRMELT